MEKVNVKKLVEDFEKEYKCLIDAGAEIRGVFGERENVENDSDLKVSISYGHEEDDFVNPFKCHIDLWVNFFTDHRKIPIFYKGVRIITVVKGDTDPVESSFDETTESLLEQGIIEVYPYYENYVIDNLEFIKMKLNDFTLTEQDALDALFWGDYERYKDGKL